MHSGVNVLGLTICILIVLLALAKIIPTGIVDGRRELLGYGMVLVSAIAALAVSWRFVWRSKKRPDEDK